RPSERSFRFRRSSDDWHCGIGYVSTNIAYYMTYFSEQREINKCCLQHDNDIGERTNFLGQMNADRKFCSCLDNIASRYIGWCVSPVFCTITRAYTFFH
ncbi:hypothetical protein PENTCL1PPCAC_2496, partial [Pristionchus entomophagus]